ncbi:penicillin amidase [Ereboglobus sp. PH5-10]|uniref:penicillin acylase family protein n=1 Tax=Ereboglobus sp. PH5-10 TaxID=2940629 RepID=UPI002406116A|nr:penicillin acylase family protein [Ereboglobus sp. PH5-10]MDF9828194.1 penicillin amidase [Ereboglobus sp. PH5-10]
MPDPTVTTLRDVRKRRQRQYARAVFAALGVCVIIATVFAWRFHQRMKASLPQLDGTAVVAGLSADVTVERDALGVPTIKAVARTDAARAMGFLHAQDRFFQMDLARRRAAGELSELFGEKTLAADKSARVHGLRAVAQKSLALLPVSQRALLDAYAEGVNAGLAQLRERPFEYLVLRAEPRPWLPEDSVLVIHAMAFDMQHPEATHERSLGIIRDWYDNKVLAYFAPVIAPNDSALDHTTAPLAPIPGPQSINLRAGIALGRANPPGGPQASPAQPEALPYRRHAATPPVYAEGSNSMAVGRAQGGMIENDMHLSLRAPNTWYRVSMMWKHVLTVTGITLPGAPVFVAGSNGSIAWGFTNSYADTSDVIVLTPDVAGKSFYYTDREILQIETRAENINVRGWKNPAVHYVETSIWGPVIGENRKGQKLALKWVFHDPEAANYGLADLEAATTVRDAIRIAKRAGIPAQNMLVADSSGEIGWTICGQLPDRFGYDGRIPATWSFGDRGWRGLLSPKKVPSVIRGPGEHISTANQRLFGGDTLALFGDGGYSPGERGARIQSLLARLGENAAPRDLLAIALDEGAPHLARWHTLLRDTLAATKNKKLASLRAAAGEAWGDETPGARAAADSAAYAIVRRFREHVIARVLDPIFYPCAYSYPDFNYNHLRIEEPVWNLIQKKPMHLLDPEYAEWDDLLLAAAGDTRRDLSAAGFSNPADARWGAFNVSRIKHPLGGGLLGALGHCLNLDMPAQELPGDLGVPRVQAPSFGASMRFAVSPGREDEGVFHMPCGQSGHPHSPYYKAGHEAWARGEPTPFLPGPAEHTLVLKAK